NLRIKLPIEADIANQHFGSSERIEAALSRYPHIKAEGGTLSSLQWPPTAARSRSFPSPSSFEEPTTPDSEPDEDDVVLDEPEPSQPDAYVPFRDDAPSQSDDTLDRGPLALFLARRLHLIWCEMNDCAPQPRSSSEMTATKAVAASEVLS